jgi:hypothetical protein
MDTSFHLYGDESRERDPSAVALCRGLSTASAPRKARASESSSAARIGLDAVGRPRMMLELWPYRLLQGSEWRCGDDWGGGWPRAELAARPSRQSSHALARSATSRSASIVSSSVHAVKSISRRHSS